jgi:hypothetical protein
LGIEEEEKEAAAAEEGCKGDVDGGGVYLRCARKHLVYTIDLPL